MRPDLSIVVVTYQSGALLDDCLASLRADAAGSSAEVLVVDNDSTDGAPDAAAERYGARVIRMGRNAGFAAANNAGIAASRGRYVLMANPDTRLVAGGLTVWLRFMDEHPAAGLSGPLLRNADGSLQESIRNYPTVLREAFECFFLHRVFPRLATRLADVVRDPVLYDGARRVDWVSGAVMMARADALRRVGGFDEGFFLYSEEIDLCRRLDASGRERWFYPGTAFLHIGGEYDASPALALENQRSKLRYFLKHEGRPRMLLLGAVTLVRLALRSVLWLPPAVADRGGRWRKRLGAGLRTLARYPGLLARFAVSAVPVTYGMDGGEAGV